MISRFEPTVRRSPAPGDVTLIKAVVLSTMEKAASDTSETVVSVRSVILILQFCDGAFGTVHEYEPFDDLTSEAVRFHVVPPSVVYSILSEVLFDADHRFICEEPAIQVSPPFGAVNWR